MEVTRRAFLKVAVIGGTSASVLGFDLKPAYAQLNELKIARATETRSTCPYCAVGCGVLIYTIGDRAKNVTPQVIHVEGDPDHPTNRGTLCPKGSSLEQDMLNLAAAHQAASAPPRRNGVAGHLLGRRPERDCQLDEEDARRYVRREGRERAHGQPLRGHFVHRRLHGHERIQLSGRQGDEEHGLGVFRKPSPCLTRPHGLKFGTNIRPRRDDQWLDRHQEHRHDVDHGRKSRREPSLRIQVGDGGQAQPQRQDYFRRPAIHPHVRHCRPVSPNSRRRRHRIPRRPDQLRDRQQPDRERISGQLHERRVHREGRVQAARRRALFRLRCRDAELRQIDVEL